MNASTIRVYHNVTARCSRCSASCSATVYEIGGRSYGSRCAEIVLGAEVFASVSGKGGSTKSGAKDEGADVMPPRPVKPRTIVAKFSGFCSCGRAVAAGAEIVYAAGEGVAGCASCEWGKGAAIDAAPGMKAAMDAAWSIVNDYSKPKSARTAARREADRLTAWWCRLSPDQCEIAAR